MAHLSYSGYAGSLAALSLTTSASSSSSSAEGQASQAHFSGHTVQALSTSSAPSSSRLSPVRPEGKHEVPAEHEPKVPLRKRKAESEAGDSDVAPAGGKLAKSESSSAQAAVQDSFDPRSFIEACMKTEPKCRQSVLMQARIQHIYAQAIESLTPQQMFALGQEMARMGDLSAEGPDKVSHLFDPLVRALSVARDEHARKVNSEDFDLPILPNVLELLRGLLASLGTPPLKFIGQLLDSAHRPAAHDDLDGECIGYDWFVIPHLIKLACQLMPQEHRGADGLEWFLKELLLGSPNDRRHSKDTSDQLNSALAFIESFPGGKTRAEAIFHLVLRNADDKFKMRGWFEALAGSKAFGPAQIGTLLDSIQTNPALSPKRRTMAAKLFVKAFIPDRPVAPPTSRPVDSAPASKPAELPAPKSDAGLRR